MGVQHPPHTIDVTGLILIFQKMYYEIIMQLGKIFHVNYGKKNVSHLETVKGYESIPYHVPI